MTRGRERTIFQETWLLKIAAKATECHLIQQRFRRTNANKIFARFHQIEELLLRSNVNVNISIYSFALDHRVKLHVDEVSTKFVKSSL